MSQRKLQIINTLISQSKGSLNFHRLENRFANRITSRMFRKYEISNSKFLIKYQLLENKYNKPQLSISKDQWIQAERKLFIWLSILYCNNKNKNYDELQDQDWRLLSFLFFDKNVLLLKYEAQKIQRCLFRVRWSKREEHILEEQIIKGKRGQWNEISQHIFFQSGGKYYKSAKHCREHWFNHMDSGKFKGIWTKQQDLTLLENFIQQGRKWSTTSKMLGNRRTEHMVKNRFNSLIKAQTKNKQQRGVSQEVIIKLLIQKIREQLNKEQVDEQHIDKSDEEQKFNQYNIKNQENVQISNKVQQEHSEKQIQLNDVRQSEQQPPQVQQQVIPAQQQVGPDQQIQGCFNYYYPNNSYSFIVYPSIQQQSYWPQVVTPQVVTPWTPGDLSTEAQMFSAFPMDNSQLNLRYY